MGAFSSLCALFLYFWLLLQSSIRCINFFNYTLADQEDNSYMDSSEIVSRTKFPESWLWSDIKLPACPKKTPNWWDIWNLYTQQSHPLQLYVSRRPLEMSKLVFHFSDTTTLQKNVPLQDSITTWQFTGISLSRTHGEDLVNTICLPFHTFYKFFLFVFFFFYPSYL